MEKSGDEQRPEHDLTAAAREGHQLVLPRRGEPPGARDERERSKPREARQRQRAATPRHDAQRRREREREQVHAEVPPRGEQREADRQRQRAPRARPAGQRVPEFVQRHARAHEEKAPEAEGSYHRHDREGRWYARDALAQRELVGEGRVEVVDEARRGPNGRRRRRRVHRRGDVANWHPAHRGDVAQRAPDALTVRALVDVRRSRAACVRELAHAHPRATRTGRCVHRGWREVVGGDVIEVVASAEHTRELARVEPGALASRTHVERRRGIEFEGLERDRTTRAGRRAGVTTW